MVFVVLLAACGCTAPPQQASGTAGENTQVAARSGPVDACALLTQAEIDVAFGRPATAGEALSDTTGMCSWSTKDNPVGTAVKTLMLQVWTTQRLQADSKFADAAAYYQFAGGSVGVAYKVPAEGVAGVGQQAAWGGKDAGGLLGMQGQMMVLHNDAVFQLVAVGLDKAEVTALGKQVVTNYTP